MDAPPRRLDRYGVEGVVVVLGGGVALPDVAAGVEVGGLLATAVPAEVGAVVLAVMLTLEVSSGSTMIG